MQKIIYFAKVMLKIHSRDRQAIFFLGIFSTGLYVCDQFRQQQ